MLGVVKDIISLIISAAGRLSEAREQSQKLAAGEVLYEMQYVTGAIVETAKDLQSALESGNEVPAPTPWPQEADTGDVVANLMKRQAVNVSQLDLCIQRLLNVGGDALDPALTQSLAKLVAAKQGAIFQLAASLGFFMYPQSAGNSLCTESNGLVQLTTGRWVQQSAADQRSIVNFILADYARHQLDLDGLRSRLATLYMDCFDDKERLAIGRARRNKEKK